MLMIAKASVVLASFIILLLQAAEPDTQSLKERGFSIQKPPKKDEWQFKDKGKLTKSQMVLANVVDDLSIEMYSEELESDKVNYDPKYTLEQNWKTISSDGQYKDVKMLGKISNSTLPSRAASGVKVWLLQMTLKSPEGTPWEWKQYCFVGHENRSGFLLNIISNVGMQEKYKKDIDYILSTIKTFKVSK